MKHILLFFIFLFYSLTVFSLTKIHYPWEKLIQKSEVICVGKIIKVPGNFKQEEYIDYVVDIQKIIKGNSLANGENTISLKSAPYPFALKFSKGIIAPEVDFSIKIGENYILFLNNISQKKNPQFQNIDEYCSVFPLLGFNDFDKIDIIEDTISKCEFMRDEYDKRNALLAIENNKKEPYYEPSPIFKKLGNEILLELGFKYDFDYISPGYREIASSFYEKYKIRKIKTKEIHDFIYKKFEENIVKQLNKLKYNNITVENNINPYNLLIYYENDLVFGRIEFQSTESKHSYSRIFLTIDETPIMLKKELINKNDITYSLNYTTVPNISYEIKIPLDWNPFNPPVPVPINLSDRFNMDFGTMNYPQMNIGIRLLDNDSPNGSISEVISEHLMQLGYIPDFEKVIAKNDSIKINGFNAGYIIVLYSDEFTVYDKTYCDYHIEKTYFISLPNNHIALLVFAVPENYFEIFEEIFQNIAKTIRIKK
ncbi:MAG: hypothetical protein ACD_79C01025G0001 [uncultured bacterium]|nr:MAG: hypothetical protein ACD_79C01025G0001 [uncultured bacterium]